MASSALKEGNHIRRINIECFSGFFFYSDEHNEHFLDIKHILFMF